MASDVMRVRLHLRQIRVLAVASDPPNELVGEAPRLMRLLAASVAALVTRAACRLEIWALQRQRVPPRRLISDGMHPQPRTGLDAEHLPTLTPT